MSFKIYQRLFRMTAELIKLNLEIPHQLDAFLRFPHRAYPAIHVAGTNGKGSVSTKIAKALELSGLKVGLYTSPHLTDFRERITVQGEWISEQAVVEGLEQLFEFIDSNQIPATFFELTTALAFDYFRKKQVDVAVIETGLGGRLDATNIIDPILTVITSISYDHTGILGETLEKIAAEKAGIIKPCVPLVLGARAAFPSIIEKAEEFACPHRTAPEIQGFYDEENQAIARTALEWLVECFPLTEEAIEAGLVARPPCRFEKRKDALFDVAHNPDGFSRLVQALDRFHPEKEIFVLLGMSRDKEYEKCLKLISKRAKKIFLVRAKGERSAPVELLGQTLLEMGYLNFVEGENASPTAIQAAEEARDADGLLVVCGSFFIMEEVLETLSLTELKR